MDIQKTFPHIESSKCRITSCASQGYNCIAWAAGDDTRWWTTIPGGYYWPGSSRNQTIECLVALFTEMGYEICTNAGLEVGFDKIALYGKDGEWQHASRQLANGKWTSKLGNEEDIEHATPKDLSGNLYGRVHCIMKRAKL